MHDRTRCCHPGHRPGWLRLAQLNWCPVCQVQYSGSSHVCRGPR